MTGIWEVVRRSKHGPIMRERDFRQKRLLPKAEEMVRDYAISRDPENPVPEDDALADKLFEAALELLLAVGCFVRENNRIIEFSRAELNEALAFARSEVRFGHGVDQRIASHRTVEDATHPVLWMGMPACTISQSLYFPAVQSHLAEPLCDVVSAPYLSEIDGWIIDRSDASEYLAARRMAIMQRQAFERAARPGTAVLNQLPGEIGTVGLLGASQDLDPGHGYRTGTMAELRIDPDELARAAFLQDWNANIGLTSAPRIGEGAHSPEIAAVLSVAHVLFGALACKANFFVLRPTHVHGNNTHREVMWSLNIAGQALARCTEFVTFAELSTRHGPVTKPCILESAAWALGVMASGYQPAFIGFAGGATPNASNPLDSRLVAEVALAVTGLSRERASELCQLLLGKYEDTLAEPELGRGFDEIYSLDSREPKPETVGHYQRMKGELADLGVPFEATT